MESIDKLRRMSRMFDSWHEEHMDGEPYIEVRHYTDGQRDFDSIGDHIRELLDEIEAEISERYIPLPLDADGVTIRIGDTVRELDDRVPMKVTSLTFYEDCVDVNTCGMNPNLLYHVKPRTIEDVLREFVNHVVTFKGSREGIPIVGIDDSLWRDYYAECADELRELMGVEK